MCISQVMKKTHYYLVDTSVIIPGAAVSELEFKIIHEDQPFLVKDLKVKLDSSSIQVSLVQSLWMILVLMFWTIFRSSHYQCGMEVTTVPLVSGLVTSATWGTTNTHTSFYLNFTSLNHSFFYKTYAAMWVTYLKKLTRSLETVIS